MKTNFLFYACLLLALACRAQDQAGEQEAAQLEDLARAIDQEPKDDSYLQQQEYFRRHPLNLNRATAEELAELAVLTGNQTEQFIRYRKLFGALLQIYELQAVPGWDIATIKKLLPFVTVADDRNMVEQLRDRWKGGDLLVLARYGRTLEKSKGYYPPADSNAAHYLGDAGKLYVRYSYNYKNLLQWGLLGDKDAGEQFFKGKQRRGFDFYGFHFFARQLGIVKAVALGDFTVNLGQGLIQWQSLAFKKSGEVLNIKRQAAALRPYNSAGEYNFQRGVGITIQQKKWETTFFISRKKVSANNITDTLYEDGAVSSFQAGGYHRTPAENEDRNSLMQTSLGGRVYYRNTRAGIGINAVYYHFSKPVQKADKPYNLFALQGTELANTSIDYSYTWRNMHLFGEFATDNHWNQGFLQGLLVSAGATLDFSMLYRNIGRAYRSLNASAFTENSLPVNESGLYTGFSFRPAAGWQLNAYADVFRFPWLKYRVDAPSAGKDFLVQVSYLPNKHVSCYLRYKNETKMTNETGSAAITRGIEPVQGQNLRWQAGISLNAALSLGQRLELIWYLPPNASDRGEGFLSAVEVSCKPQRKKWRSSVAVQYFETTGYNERVYTYESDLMYSFSVPFYYDKGFRYYCNLGWDATGILPKTTRRKSRLALSLRWAQTIYPGKTSIGSGLDEIRGNHRSDLKVQIMFSR